MVFRSSLKLLALEGPKIFTAERKSEPFPIEEKTINIRSIAPLLNPSSNKSLFAAAEIINLDEPGSSPTKRRSRSL